MLDTKGQQTTAMDLVLVGNKDQVDFNAFDGQGGMFRSYSAPRIMDGETADTQEMYVLSTTSTRYGAVGEGKIGTVTITPKEGAKTVSLMVKMTPNTDTSDSNVAVVDGDSVVDALDTVVNAEFKVVEGPCGNAQKMEALTISGTNKAGTVMIENNTFKSKFDKEEKKDRMMQWMVVNHKMLAVGAIVIVLLLVGGIVLVTRRKKK